FSRDWSSDVCSSDLMHFRQESLKRRNDCLNVPDKDPRVPEKVTAPDKSLGQFQIRFFGKGLYLMEIIVQLVLRILDVTVTGIGAGRNNPQGEQYVCL